MDMLWTRLFGTLAVLAGVFLWAGGFLSTQTDSYKLPLRDVHALLARTPLPPVVLGSRGGHDMPQFATNSPIPALLKVELLPPPDEDSEQDERDFTIDATDPKRVVWKFQKDGVEALHFVATLEPVGPTATRIAVDVTGPTDGPLGNVAEKLKTFRTVKNMYVLAMQEQIGAIVENRNFNLSRIYPAMMAAAAANSTQLMSNLNQSIAADQRRVQNNIDKAYERAGYERP